MMELFGSLGDGFAQALTPTNIAFSFLGVLIGTMVGVIPGIGPTTAIALLIPVSFNLEPVSGLANKFLQAEPSPVDHVVHAGESVTIDGRVFSLIDLAGHSMAQIGVGVDLDTAQGVLFAADAFFGSEPLAKHGVPYLVDARGMQNSLRRLQSRPAAWYVPGHGEPEDDAQNPVFAENFAALERAFDWLDERVRRAPVSTEELLVEFAAAMGMRLDNPSSWVLNRAALLGFLAAMEREGTLRVVLEEGRWLWA